MKYFDLDINKLLMEKNCRFSFHAGVDEVGRGPLAGPVVAACVVVPLIDEAFLNKLSQLGIADSKKLTEKKRGFILKELGIEKLEPHEKIEHTFAGCSFNFSIVEVDEETIDHINILNASLLAMRKSYEISSSGLDDSGLLLIDGNKIPKELPLELKTEAVVKGDTKSLIIALASIIAKVYRDCLMKKIGEEYPGYGLERHAGYPTQMHRKAIEKLGPTPYHRKSFKGVKEYVRV